MKRADFIKAALWMALIPALLFLSAGTLDWPAAWIFLSEYLIGGFAVMLWLARHDPGLFKERLSGAFQQGQTVWDKVFMGFIIVVWYGWLVLIALDARRWRLSHMPAILSVVGALLIAVGLVVVWLSFRENASATRHQHRSLRDCAPPHVFGRKRLHDRHAFAARVLARLAHFAFDPRRVDSADFH